MSQDPSHDEQPARVLTAFLVIVPEDGTTPYATTDIDPHTTLVRNPTPADIRRACQDVVHDYNARAAAEYVTKARETETTAARVRRARARRAEEK